MINKININLIYGFILILAVISCEKDIENNDESYMVFNANGTDYELNHLTCKFYPTSSLELFDNMTHIRGVQNINNKKLNDSVIVQLDLAEINIYFPGQNTGIWTVSDSISFIIGIEENVTFIKEKNKSTDSDFLIEIEEYDNIYCTGKFSGDLKNEYNDKLKIENGRFKIKVD
jgi:hypothetical protein